MALEMRTACERCATGLDAAGEAYVCSYECTFCRTCRDALGGVCPNCSGELLRRPRRGVKAEPEQPAQPDAIAPTPAPPYYAVTFTSLRTSVDAGYGETSERMAALASLQPGYLGIESAREPGGLGITTSYWRSLDDIRAWKAVEEHRRAQQRGRDEWYRAYKTRVSRVEYDYAFDAAFPRAC